MSVIFLLIRRLFQHEKKRRSYTSKRQKELCFYHIIPGINYFLTGKSIKSLSLNSRVL